MPINPGADYKIKPQTEDQDAMLRQFLQAGDQAYNTAQQGANQRGLAQTQSNLKTGEQQRALDMVQGMDIKPGDTAKVGDVAFGRSNEGRLQFQQSKAEADAIKHAQDVYNHGASKISDQAQALGELQKVAANPNQMTLGTARSLALKTLGMNRFNEDEAKNILPGTLQSGMSKLFAAGGGDDAAITAEQAKTIQDFSGQMGGSLKQRHETLKQMALENYSTSPYANSSRYDMLKGQIGGALDRQLSGLGSQDVAQGPQQPVTGMKTMAQPAAPGGVFDRLTALLKGPQSQGQPQAQAAPDRAAVSAPQTRSIVKVERNRNTGATRTTYSDGTVETK